MGILTEMKITLYKILVYLTKIILISFLFGFFLKLLSFILPVSTIPAFLLTIGIYLLFEYYIYQYFDKFWQNILLPDYVKINLLVDNYNQKLNSLIKRDEIIEQFTFLFTQAFSETAWSLYWIKGTYFEKIEQSKAISISLPEQIEIKDEKHLRELRKTQESYFHLNDIIIRDMELKNYFKNIFEEKQFEYLIPIKSFHNMVGIIFFDNSLEKYIKLRSLRKNLLKIINKTSEMAEQAELYDEAEFQFQYNEKLLEVNKIITSSLNLNTVLSSIMDAITRFVQPDASTIFLVDEINQELKHQYMHGYDENEIKKLRIKLNQGIVGKAIQSGLAYNIPDVEKSKDYCELRKSTKAQLTIPLYSGEKAIGAISLESDKLNYFTEQDMALLKTFAGHASIAINNAWLYKNVIEKKKLESDLLNASQVQQSLLQKRAPYLAGIELIISNIPCKLVGGDFYDIQKLDKNNFILSIGDVSGKGSPGALLMAVVMAGLRSFYKQVYSVCEIVARLNNLMTDATSTSSYATVFLAIVDYEKKEIVYTNAGHNPPLLIRKNGEVERLSGGGIVVGFRNDMDYQQLSAQLNEGDIVILFTDGLEEAMNSQKEEFGIERVLELIKENHELPLSQLKQQILQKVRTFTGIHEFDDDLTFILMRINKEFFEVKSN